MSPRKAKKVTFSRKSPVHTRQYSRKTVSSSRASPVQTRINSQVPKILPTITNIMSANDNQVITHELYTSYSNVPTFSGEPGTVDVDMFLNRVDTHIANKNVQGDSQKIETLKHYVDAEKGRARHVIRYNQLQKIKVYKEYKDSFRKYFKKKSDLDLLRAMVNIFQIRKSAKEDRSAYIARLDVLREELIPLFQSSEWKTNAQQISLEQVAKLIVTSKFLAETSPAMAERLFKDVKATTEMGDIDLLMIGYDDNTNETHVLPVNTSEGDVDYTKRSRTPTRDQHARPEVIQGHELTKLNVLNAKK